jgi:oligopeptide transport system permease protein
MTENDITLEPRPAGSAGLPLTRRRESLWQDALRRLLRNRAAVLGGSIVLLLILTAFLAPYIAVKSYEVQVRLITTRSLRGCSRFPRWAVRKISNEYPLGADYGVGTSLAALF